MQKTVLVTLFVIALLIFGIGLQRLHKPQLPMNSTKTSFKNGYLPLGDSYTIGESIQASDNYPNQLIRRLQPTVANVGIMANKSVTGYTTADLIRNELPLVAQTKPAFVTILIGVNDYVQGVSATTFEKNLRYIVATTQQNMAQPANIVLITIPDYAKTPAGARYGDPIKATSAINGFNTIIKQVGSDNNLAVVDIFAISQQVSDNGSLTAEDGLHPSAEQYRLWTDLLVPVVKEQVTFN